MLTVLNDLTRLGLPYGTHPTLPEEVVNPLSRKSCVLSGFDIGGSGHLRPSGRPVEDFSLSRTALQIRYRYEIQPLSDIFLVYSRGGLWADDDISGGPWNLFQNGWDEVDAEQIIAKIRLRF